MRCALGFALAFAAATVAPLAPAVAACSPSRDALLILDASYSMLRRLNTGMTRFAAARDVIDQTVDLFPADARIALRVFGSGAQTGRNDCRDTVLKVPFAPAATNAALIKLALAESHARGVTPIAFTLQQAAGDFHDSSISRTIVLVSDGAEDCNGDPCGAAAALYAAGFVINTIGFGTSVQGSRQLQCIAKATGGEYYAVPVAAQLQDKLMQALGICPVALGPALSEFAAAG
jgi:Ca-activated chloride channel family protein